MEQINAPDPIIIHPTGSRVEHFESGRTGVVTAQHINRKKVNVQWQPGWVTAEDVEHVRRA